MRYQCQNCPRATIASEISVRVAGWIIWTGATIGGTETTRIYCPTCAGREAQDTNPPTWDAVCDTCHWRMSDADNGEDDDAPYTERDARNWKLDHECEPDVRLITPEETEKDRQRLADHRAKYAAAVPS